MVLHAQMRTRTRHEGRGMAVCGVRGAAGEQEPGCSTRSSAARTERVEGRCGAVERERSLFERERCQDSVDSHLWTQRRQDEATKTYMKNLEFNKGKTRTAKGKFYRRKS